MRTNLKKKALLPLIAMVLVSVISLSSITYAWFTMTDTATVTDLNVTVTEADGIQISLDAKNWASMFSAADINDVDTEYLGNTNMYPGSGKISPVSTNAVATLGKLSMFKGELLDTNNIVITDEVDGTSTNYIVFDLFFKMSEAKTVSLDAGSKVEGTSAGAARVAFLDLGKGDDWSAAQSRNALDDGASVVVWDPTGSSASYRGLTAKTTTEAGIATEGGFVTDEDYSDVVTGVKTVNTDVKFDLQAGINKVRVYIWLEGQDPECLNEISAGDIKTLLKFTQA